MPNIGLNRTDLQVITRSNLLRHVRDNQQSCRRLELKGGFDDDEIHRFAQGLDVLRQQPWVGGWILKGIVLAGQFTDIGLATMAAYVSRDPTMRELWVSGDRIKLGEKLDSIIRSINSSNLSELSIESSGLLPSGIASLFTYLNAPRLRILRLIDCHLDPQSTDAITSYLCSPHARNLRCLELRTGDLGPDVLRQFINTVEKRNFTLLSFISPDTQGRSFNDFFEKDPFLSSDTDIEGLKDHEPRRAKMLARNRSLTARVQKAALRCLPNARILLNACPSPTVLPSPARLTQSPNIPDTSNCSIPFRLLDLPGEIVHLIIRHTSGDATALSHSQFARLRLEAEGKEGLRRLMAAAERGKNCAGRSWNGEAKAGSKMEWLESQGLDRWETDIDAC